ncbi:MAG: nitroreductase [Alphaproteobacteria bacterium]|nr:nitroreductase [Alphaproteobacteria bacterium]
MNVSEALKTRISVRAFKPDPVPRAVVEEILLKASRAPSGGNLQPWKVHVLLGAAKDELVRRTKEQMAKNPRGGVPEYHIYPPNLTEPYSTRRFRVGEQMYATMNIPREDKARRLQQFVKNWEFFGAPVGLIFSIDRQMQQGQWSDLGGFLQSIMLLAREYGLHTCAQEAWAPYHEVIREYLKVPQEEMIFCGMSLGYADTDAPINTLYSERAALGEWAVIKETV